MAIYRRQKMKKKIRIFIIIVLMAVCASALFLYIQKGKKGIKSRKGGSIRQENKSHETPTKSFKRRDGLH